MLLLQSAPRGPATWPGLALAAVSGAITSGLGYAVWYRVLPQLGAFRAATGQLAVPVLAALAGAALLGEPLTFRLIASEALVLGGIALALVAGKRAGVAGAAPVGTDGAKLTQ